MAEDGEARLADCGVARRYRKGTLLMQEGDAGETVYVIRSGSAKVFSEDQQGREIVYNLLGPGDYIGEMSLDGGPRSASVITLEPTECAVLSRQQVRAFMAARPEFAFELLCTVIRRARDATEKARGLAQDSVYARLKALFERTAAPLGDGTFVVEPALTQQEIAARIGCGREMVSRILSELRAGDYVRSERRRIVILRKLPSRW